MIHILKQIIIYGLIGLVLGLAVVFAMFYFDTTLKITSFDKRNSVAEMINIINATPTTISSVTSTKNSANECVTKFKLQVSNLEDLNHVIVALGNLSEILKIERVVK